MNGAVIAIAGTDTGVGKTFVGCGLLAGLTACGYQVAAVKPVESGVTLTAESDAERLRLAAGGWQSFEQVNAYQFSEALSPHLAARRSATAIDAGKLFGLVEQACNLAALTLVEAAGGVMVSLTEELRAVEFFKALNAPTILVVGSRLGAINQATLSIEALQSRQVPLIGYVLNHCYPLEPEQALAIELNRPAIAEALAPYGCKELAAIPHKNQEGMLSENNHSLPLTSGLSVLTQSVIDYCRLAR